MHLDSRGLQEPLHIHQAPQRECRHHTDHHQYERERRPIRVFAALERAPISVEREDGGVIERAAGRDQQDVFKAYEQRERLVNGHVGDRPAQRRQRDVANNRERSRAVDAGGVEEVLGNRADGRREDEHAERGPDESVRQNDDQQRVVVAQVDGSQSEDMHDDLVEQAALVRVDHPQPQERIDHRWTHPRKQPYRAEESAEPPRHGGGHECQQECEGDVEDSERGQDEDKSDAQRTQ